MSQRVKGSATKAKVRPVGREIPTAPPWPTFQGNSQFVGTSPSGRVTVYIDPNLGSAGLKNAQDLVDDGDRIASVNDGFFGTSGGPVSAIIFAISGMTDGRGGAFHLGCDYTSGAAIEICASFGNSARVSALLAAMLCECSTGGNLCSTSAGEALSRLCAAVISNNALPDFVTAQYWAQSGMPDFVNQNDPNDQNPASTGCGMAFLSWCMSQGYGLNQIAPGLVSLGNTATLAQLYAKLTSDTASNAWPKFMTAVQTLPGPISTDDPFGALQPTQPAASARRTVGIRPLAPMNAPDLEKSEVVRTVERLEQRFESVLSEPTLDNFDGSVSVRVMDEAGKELPRDPSRPARSDFLAAAGQRCRLEMTFIAGPARGEGNGVYLDLRIRKGNTASQVTFDVFLDARTIELGKDRASVTFDPNRNSGPLPFSFLAPTDPGKHELFIEISQKNRLLQSLLIRIRVGGDR